jgi:hypothetical protein
MLAALQSGCAAKRSPKALDCGEKSPLCDALAGAPTPIDLLRKTPNAGMKIRELFLRA